MLFILSLSSHVNTQHNCYTLHCIKPSEASEYSNVGAPNKTFTKLAEGNITCYAYSVTLRSHKSKQYPHYFYLWAVS
jgi:hypothetical protein